jgi:hypothetical protein
LYDHGGTRDAKANRKAKRGANLFAIALRVREGRKAFTKAAMPASLYPILFLFI